MNWRKLFNTLRNYIINEPVPRWHRQLAELHEAAGSFIWALENTGYGWYVVKINLYHGGGDTSFYGKTPQEAVDKAYKSKFPSRS